MSRARLLVALALAALYLRGLAPSVHVHDAGELTAAAWTLGVGHPPGAPLYMLLSKLFLLLVPLGSIAWRASLFSAAAAVGAFFVFDAVARRLTGRPGLSLAGASAFGLATTLWSQAEMAEVYTLEALLLLLFLWVFAGDEAEARRPALGAFLWGLLLACHVGLAPLTPVALWLLARPADRGLRPRALAVARLLPPLLVPGLLYLYLPLRSLRDPFVDWGNPESPQALWWHLTNRQVRGRMFSLPWEEYLHRAGEYGALLLANLHLLLPFALLGVAFGWRRRRGVAVFLTLVCAADAAFVVLLDTAPLASEAYAIPSVAALALLAVWGLASFRGPRLAGGATALAAGAAFLSLGLNFSADDLHRNFLARDAAESLLAQTARGSTLFVQEDSTTNAVAYLVGVEGARPDLEIFDRFGNLFGSLYDRPLFAVAAAERPGYRRSREEPAVLSRLDRGRPVFFSTSHLEYAPERFHLVPGEFAARAFRSGVGGPTPVAPRFPAPRPGAHPDWMSRQILAELATRRAEVALSQGRSEEARAALAEGLACADLPELFLLVGQQARRAGDRDLALRGAEEALSRHRGFAPALVLKGSLLMGTPREDEAYGALRAAAVADPSLPQPHALLGQMAARRGDWGDAREAFGRSLALDPRQPELLSDRAQASLALADRASAEADFRSALALKPDLRRARLGLSRLLMESGRLPAAREVLCEACRAEPAGLWPVPALRDFLLVAAGSGFPSCVGPWLAQSPPSGEEARALSAAYSAAETQVRRAQQR